MYGRATNTFKHQGGRRVLRFQTVLIPEADDAPDHPDVQAVRQAVLLQKGGSGCLSHGSTCLVTGGDRQGSRPLPCRTKVI